MVRWFLRASHWTWSVCARRSTEWMRSSGRHTAMAPTMIAAPVWRSRGASRARKSGSRFWSRLLRMTSLERSSTGRKGIVVLIAIVERHRAGNAQGRTEAHPLSPKPLGKIWGNRGPCERNVYTIRQRSFFDYHLFFRENATYPPYESNVTIGRRARLRAWLTLREWRFESSLRHCCSTRTYVEMA